MKYRILGSQMSPFVRKVRVFCAEKGIDYELEAVSPFDPPEGFAEISPLKRIPVLVIEDDDGTRRYLPDSSVICAFLDQMHPEHRLIPEAPLARGEALWFEEYADSELASSIGFGIFRPVMVARMQGQEPDMDKAHDTLENRLPRPFTYLEGQIGDKPFLVEDRLTIADIATTTSFVNMQHCGFEPDEKRWPRLSAYLKRMMALPSFQACIAEERKMIGD